MSLRKSDVFLCSLFIVLCLFTLMFAHDFLQSRNGLPVLREKVEMVRTLELTDLCLFTDARYTRHPAMADLHAPFQDHPMSFEHYPSGALVAPPLHLYRHALGR